MKTGASNTLFFSIPTSTRSGSRYLTHIIVPSTSTACPSWARAISRGFMYATVSTIMSRIQILSSFVIPDIKHSTITIAIIFDIPIFYRSLFYRIT